ncbi:MAG: zinc-dependent peptidase [Planctomycetia bacterium]|nr:zinc-dependent peptidase [Planctomycetia bacterium]
MFGWLRERRRRAIRTRPFPAEWEEILRRNVRQAAWLDGRDAERLRAWVAVFLSEKRFEGCRGLEITDEVRVSIAGQAGIVMLGFEGELLDRLRSVLVYPGDYLAPKSAPLDGGGELEWREERLGETWAGGSMVLSWPRVVEGGRLRDGPRSVVIHECAHAFDMLDGEVDGVPPLRSPHDARRWASAVDDCQIRFEEALDEGRSVPFDEYAAESPGEFFAVASECFFQDPHRLFRFDQALYELLLEAWRQDPKSRVPTRPR